MSDGWNHGAAGCEGPRLPCGQPAPSLPFREDIWFDDVDPADIEAAIGPKAAAIARKQLGHRVRSVTLVKEQAFGGYAGWAFVGGGPQGAPPLSRRARRAPASVPLTS